MSPTPEFQPPEIRDQYPGMNVEDNKLCSAFLKLYAGQLNAVAFNVRVGEGVLSEVQHLPEPYKSQAIASSALRIDMVAIHKDSIPWQIIEFRRSAGPGAIGALLCYQYHWPASWFPAINLYLVTDYLRRDIQRVCDYHAIQTITVKME